MEVEQAVQRNTKQPDYDVLDIITANLTDETRAIQTRSFSQWVGEQQKNEAFVLKNVRQWHEEKRELAKGQDGHPKGVAASDP